MNTKNRFLLLLLLSVFVLQSCDSLLDVAPETSFTEANFWKTESHFKGAVNTLYNNLPSKGFDGRSDEQWSGGNNTSNGSWSLSATSGDYTNPYRRIAEANAMIENAPGSSLSESTKNRFLGEALFFRAYWYFDLVCKYGDVPLVLKTFKETQDPDLKMGRAPRETIIQQCYTDLRQAAEYLPTRTDLQYEADEFARCRATRSAALALLARIGLYEGTMRKYHNLSSDYNAHLDVCLSAFNELREEGHQLYTDGGTHAYLGQFYEERNHINLEIIFRKAHGPNGTGPGNWNTSYTGGLRYNNGVATRAMIDMYLYADGLPGEKSQYYLPPADETSYNSVFGFEGDASKGGLGGAIPNGHPRDPRMGLTFWRQDDPDDNTDVSVAGYRIAWRLSEGSVFNHYDIGTAQMPGYHVKKGFVGQFYEINSSGSDCNDNILIRWGEMLLTYAEALFERNGSITDAQLDETVNALRARAGFVDGSGNIVKLTNALVTSNGLNMRDEIRRERSVELMFENRRYNDIIRWKIAEDVLPENVIGIHYFFDEASNPLTAQDLSVSYTDANGYHNGVFVYPAPNMRVLQVKSARRFRPERDYFYYIPTDEIVKSDNNIVQNPNWSEN